jgi:hypothetical protein
MSTKTAAKKTAAKKTSKTSRSPKAGKGDVNFRKAGLICARSLSMDAMEIYQVTMEVSVTVELRVRKV